MSINSLDEALDLRMRRHVKSLALELYAEIDELRQRIDELNPERWPAMMTRADAAAYCGIHATRLDWLVRQGHIPAIVPDGLEHRRYLRSDLDAWMRSNS